MLIRAATIAIGLLLAASSPAPGIDWMFAPSTYTHDPATASRVCQYAEPPPVYSYQSPDYRRSGYRHHTSINRVGANADRLHVVEEWGRAVRPYGEWKFPYRPYSVPYDAWGPPFGGLGHGGFGRRGFGGPGGFPRPWLGPYAQPPGVGSGPGRHGPDHGAGNRAARPRRFDNPHFDDQSPRGNAPSTNPTGDRWPPAREPSRLEQDRSADGAFGRIEQGAT